jgi:hypothetical protein
VDGVFITPLSESLPQEGVIGRDDVVEDKCESIMSIVHYLNPGHRKSPAFSQQAGTGTGGKLSNRLWVQEDPAIS